MNRKMLITTNTRAGDNNEGLHLGDRRHVRMLSRRRMYCFVMLSPPVTRLHGTTTLPISGHMLAMLATRTRVLQKLGSRGHWRLCLLHIFMINLEQNITKNHIILPQNRPCFEDILINIIAPRHFLPEQNCLYLVFSYRWWVHTYYVLSR